jgi:hypothetical protein
MQQPPGDDRGQDVWRVERAIVLQVLRDDRDQRWSRARLASEISDFEPALIELALSRLQQDKVLSSTGTRVSASSATRRLDQLELIGV